MEQEGLFFLRPVYELLFTRNIFNLNLPRSSVSVCYKTYHNTYKGIQIGPNDLSLEDAVNQELTPGKVKIMIRFDSFQVAAIDINGGSHALVLDTVEKITQYNQCGGYEVGDHKLIFKNTYDDEENGKPKKYTINAKSSKAPNFFYFVHINVELNTIANCFCQEGDCFCRENEKRELKQLMKMVTNLNKKTPK